MDAVFKYELDRNEIEKIEKYCDSVDYCAAEQFIGWITMFHKPKICYFYLLDEGVIKSFCQITEKYWAAQISLGPVCCDKEVMVKSIDEIIYYYQKKHFYYLGIQMYFKTGFDLDYIEYQLNKKHDIKYFFNPENTKTSIEIDLGKSTEDIFDQFSSSHRNSIKKAIKLGVTIETINEEKELKTMLGIFKKMCDKRKIHDDTFASANEKEICDFLINKRKGQILAIKDKDGVMVGGIILIFQGNTVRMYKGASDPERRDIPMNHLLIYEIVKNAKNANFKYLDLWGYNHFVNKNDQVFQINKFKMGFGGYWTFFAKKMNVNLFPMGYYIFKTLLKIKKILPLKT